MSVQSIIKKYLKTFQQSYRDSLLGNQHTAELSYRPPLDALFRELAAELNKSPDIVIILEPRRQAQMGRPDWRIHDRKTLGVYGYIEAKGFDQKAFDPASHEGQLRRYLSLGHKLIITDGVDFVFSFGKSTKLQKVSLIDKSKMNIGSDWSSLTQNPLFESKMSEFFSDPVPQYYDERRLVEQVAIRTRLLSDEILKYANTPKDEAFNDIEKVEISLLDGLKGLVYNHNFTPLRQDNIFADFAAQVIMFTLLYAHRIECSDSDSATEKEQKIKQFLLSDMLGEETLRPFLTIMHYICGQSEENNFVLTWTDECVRFLSFVHMTEKQRQSPNYHKLFELFLSKFDPQSRFDYGAYYTPSELADCIVRLVEVIAKEHFDGASIFADENTIIDPCCGTGSFLESIKNNDVRHGAYYLCGIEILPAPYMLANYRMAVLNKEFEGDHSKNVLLLANALSNYVFGEGTADTDTVEGFELNRAHELSSRPITLVIGNPPSSDSPKTNTGADFSKLLTLMDDFRPPEKKRHARQNIQKQINNPYLQFLRWGCKMLEHSSDHAILAFIVPATFLEAESYQFARKYIAEHFSSAWIVSVDADARTGIRSDSLFKTQQGRAILIAVRRYGEAKTMSGFRYFDISLLAMTDKADWLGQDAEASLRMFSYHPLDKATCTLRPSLIFNEKLYSSFWPVSGGSETNAIFKNHNSGIKLAPTSMFTHIKTPMLKRRSKDIMRRGLQAADEWLGAQDKPPVYVETCAFADALNEISKKRAIDEILDQNIVNYAFRPFFPMKAFLWQTLLHKFSKVGGGGTRRRPEISMAYSSKSTVGFAMSHSPKDQNSSLKPFSSFCWYYPDNDLCRRGNAYIYLNQYPAKRNSGNLVSNIDKQLEGQLSAMLGIDGVALSTEVVFYVYAILCSQVYLDEFEGALFTVSRADMRPRIPIVNNADVFKQLAKLGRKVAELEKIDYVPQNHAGYDYASVKAMVPPNFKLSWTKASQPFDEENETITLSDNQTIITIPCPREVQRINISGYDLIKNVWMKFNSYNFTHCVFTADDMESLLNLVNKLLEYTCLVGEIDTIMHDVIIGSYPLIV